MTPTSTRSFWLRRLHSLSGVFPIGAFLLEHMFTNSFILQGPEAYNEKIEFLRHLPYVAVLEIVFIGLPILYHAGYGIYVWMTGKVNLRWYPYAQNWLYVLQRWTGVMALVYIGVHVYETRIVNALYGTEVSFARMQEIVSQPQMFWFYVIGLLAVCFHFANGLWGFCVSWGMTIGPKSQRAAGIFSGILGLTIFGAGLNALIYLIQ
ncbi:MAG: succinate dehydrogenase [Candidatus Omnitrophica bacterium CG11_big_fil_rev_8_21_14_0_20_45_26]|uniref:Succinate dehydrogenase n=1 Tax=Candidatus Abzuiibacterium crystallinum TaxID=1974748 RepID=A0A2H0LRC5_9BACT|nr:MAG: succinate dehydrogenase [Candidatus Omnitrophica bacterium CG11_big_fil_rev_8_21_14_0_20_45_26]PIW65753.1 MAG: succinate dehydrogenase [Candidatus Omnitrophica bacterium CG12_big_fil_rev_8_21_14_0_65_45_16]